MDYLYECIVNGYGLESGHVILTFDDGYKNNLHIVAPLLKAWKLPFTIFVSTRHISECVRFPAYYIRVAILYTEKEAVYLRSINKGFDLTTREKRLAAARTIIQIAKRAPLDLVEHIRTECIRQLTSDKWAELNARFSSDEPMSWDDVIQATSMGATIGSHCHDHCILHSNQQEEEVHRQLTKSKAAIEANIMDCKYMAYPNGTLEDISSIAYAAVKSAQFRMAFSTILGEVTSDGDCFLAPRISAETEYEEFCYLLNRTSRQNEIYKTARLQLLHRVKELRLERAQIV
jgi:peptidoglycan/xylan/chitin deacetylase (PgdA/CDA1 family)